LEFWVWSLTEISILHEILINVIKENNFSISQYWSQVDFIFSIRLWTFFISFKMLPRIWRGLFHYFQISFIVIQIKSICDNIVSWEKKVCQTFCILINNIRSTFCSIFTQFKLIKILSVISIFACIPFFKIYILKWFRYPNRSVGKFKAFISTLKLLIICQGVPLYYLNSSFICLNNHIEPLIILLVIKVVHNFMSEEICSIANANQCIWYSFINSEVVNKMAVFVSIDWD